MELAAAIALASVCMFTSGFAGRVAFVSSSATVPQRDIEFTYSTRIAAPPSGARSSKIWIPLPQTDAYQCLQACSSEEEACISYL